MRAGKGLLGEAVRKPDPALFLLLLLDPLTNHTTVYTSSHTTTVFTAGEDEGEGGDAVAPPPQSTWEEAREARKLTQHQVSRECAVFHLESRGFLLNTKKGATVYLDRLGTNERNGNS